MTVNEVAEIFSIFLTIPLFFVAFIVMQDWYPHLTKLIRGHRVSLTWFGAGVFVSFFGQVADNLYWLLAWSALFIEHPIHKWLFFNGVYLNIPFRQGCGIASAYLHICGLYAMVIELGGEPDNGRFKKLHMKIALSFAVSGLLVVGLFLLRGKF